MKSDRKCPPDLSVHLQICLTKNVHLQICAAVPNRHLFPFVSLPAYLVEKYRYKYTHKTLWATTNTNTKSFLPKFTIAEFSKQTFFCVFVFVCACSQALLGFYGTLFSLLPLPNVWFWEKNLNISLKFIFPNHWQEKINQLGGNRSPRIGRVFHETRSCLDK